MRTCAVSHDACGGTLTDFHPHPHTPAGPWNAAAIVVFQYLNLILSAIGYTVAAGASMQ
jgi:hypothetical protein